MRRKAPSQLAKRNLNDSNSESESPSPKRKSFLSGTSENIPAVTKSTSAPFSSPIVSNSRSRKCSKKSAVNCVKTLGTVNTIVLASSTALAEHVRPFWYLYYVLLMVRPF